MRTYIIYTCAPYSSWDFVRAHSAKEAAKKHADTNYIGGKAGDIPIIVLEAVRGYIPYREELLTLDEDIANLVVKDIWPELKVD